MYKAGDNVIYGANGVMSIVDIREESIGDGVRSYYVLRPISVRSDSFTFVPVDNENLVSLMRPLLSKDEIISEIKRAGELPECEWNIDNRRRADSFKKILESGNRAEILAMVRTIYNAGKRRELEGKKNFLADDMVMKRAEKLIASEISVVLGISEEEVPAFIEKYANAEK